MIFGGKNDYRQKYNSLDANVLINEENDGYQIKTDTINLADVVKIKLDGYFGPKNHQYRLKVSGSLDSLLKDKFFPNIYENIINQPSLKYCSKSNPYGRPIHVEGGGRCKCIAPGRVCSLFGKGGYDWRRGPHRRRYGGLEPTDGRRIFLCAGSNLLQRPQVRRSTKRHKKLSYPLWLPCTGICSARAARENV